MKDKLQLIIRVTIFTFFILMIIGNIYMYNLINQISYKILIIMLGALYIGFFVKIVGLQEEKLSAKDGD